MNNIIEKYFGSDDDDQPSNDANDIDNTSDGESISSFLFDIPRERGDEIMNAIQRIMDGVRTAEDCIHKYPECLDLADGYREGMWVTYLFGMQAFRIKQLEMIDAVKNFDGS